MLEVTFIPPVIRMNTMFGVVLSADGEGWPDMSVCNKFSSLERHSTADGAVHGAKGRDKRKQLQRLEEKAATNYKTR